MVFPRYYLLLVLSFVLARFAGAQNAQIPEHYQAAVDSAQKMILEAWHTHKYPGMAVAAAAEGRLIWSYAIGFADLEQRVPMWPHSRFRIASISKPITAAAAAKLYSQGRLDIDASVQQYVPDFPQKRWPITTRQLGAHLGGIRSYEPGEMLSAVPYATVSDGLEIFAADTLMHEPGTRFLYPYYSSRPLCILQQVHLTGGSVGVICVGKNCGVVFVDLG